MSKFTNRADLLIAAGESIKMQEAAHIEPIVKCNSTKPRLIAEMLFTDPPHFYEFPLAVVEGKPVFVGDELYNLGNGAKLDAMHVHPACWNQFSWNPPKPKTVMVELPIAIAEYYAKYSDNLTGIACRKALEEK